MFHVKHLGESFTFAPPAVTRWVESEELPDWGGREGAALAAAAAIMLNQYLDWTDWKALREDAKFMERLLRWRQERHHEDIPTQR